MTSHDGYGERWFDQEAGPVVRPYAVTKGRTESATAFGLIDVVMTTGERPSEQFRPGPEHRRILGVCRRPVPVVDLTSEMTCPSGWSACSWATSPRTECCGSSPLSGSRYPTTAY